MLQNNTELQVIGGPTVSTHIRSARLRASVWSILATCSAGCLAVASAEEARSKPTDSTPPLSTASRDTVQYGRDTSNTTLEEVISVTNE